MSGFAYSEGDDLSEYEGNILVRTQLEIESADVDLLRLRPKRGVKRKETSLPRAVNIRNQGARRASIIGNDLRSRVRAVTQEVVKAAAAAQREAELDAKDKAKRKKMKKKKVKRNPIVEGVVHVITTPTRLLKQRKEAKERKMRRERDMKRRAEEAEQRRKKEAEKS